MSCHSTSAYILFEALSALYTLAFRTALKMTRGSGTTE